MSNEAEGADPASSTDQELVDALRAQVQQQHDAIKWLEQQRETWEQTARDQLKIIEELRAYTAQQRESMAWLEDQRARWQAAANANEQIIEELRARVRRVEEFAQRTISSGSTFG